MKIIRGITITDAMLTATNVAETDYSAWSSVTTYAAAGRCIVTTSGVHKIYESLAGGNLNHDPVADCALETPLYWKEVSATNRWKAFDARVGSQTSQAPSITYTITPGQVFDSIAFLNLDAVTIRVVMTDPVEGVVYDKTIDLMTTVITGSAAAIDWYSYFFSSFFRITDVVKLDLPPYLNAVLDITITYTGGTAKVGGIIIGQQANLGATQIRPSIGIHDYSVKEQDDYGVWSVTERAFSKKMTCDVQVLTASLDDVALLLASYRATPIVWIGDETRSSLIVYGFFKDFSIVLEYLDYAICSIEIEGLT